MERFADGASTGRWWRLADDSRIECLLCPRGCRLNAGDRGFCFVRSNRDGQMVLETYGRSTGFCIDPIEKKPLNQFLPGTPVLSFGTAGCNLGCKFCQNWDISKSREVDRLSHIAEPEEIAAAALNSGCRSVAFTYNDPVIWAEYAIDVAKACRRVGLRTIAVTAGYISPGAREEFFDAMDAANVDLKAFTESFYYKVTSSHLQPVLDTLEYLRHQTSVWTEITNLIIPQENDSEEELQRMSDWIVDHLGVDVPIHFSAFHPDWRMLDRPRTPPETLARAYEIARQAGMRYVYVGNVHDIPKQSTYCPHCQQVVIERDWYELVSYQLQGNQCRHCGGVIAGHYESQPGSWGRKRQPIQIQSSTLSPPFASKPPSKIIPQEATMTSNVSSRPDSQSSMELLSDQELQQIQQFAAREVIRAVVGPQQVPRLLLSGSLAERPSYGVFVTLKRQGALRSCCGSLGESQPLAATTINASKRTALEDPRFPPVSPSELTELSLSVSVLGPPRRLTCPATQRYEQVQVGQHGLRIFGEGRGGLLLPSVAPEQGWNAIQFLGGVCRKAGLPEDAWKSEKTSLEIFDGQLVEGTIEDAAVWVANTAPPPLTQAEIQGLTTHAMRNIAAIRRGLTPAYVALDVADGTVGGLIVQLVHLQSHETFQLMQWSTRQGLPLQSTLFALCEQAANWLMGKRIEDWSLKLALLHLPVPCGTMQEPTLKHLNPATTGLLAGDGQQATFVYDSRVEDPQVLLDYCSRHIGLIRERAQLIAWHVSSLSEAMFATTVPQSSPGTTERSPAVAGSFYPSDDLEREKAIEQLGAGLPEIQPQRVMAAMTPHAGLIYSWRIAYDVWRRIALPQSILVIGPKHTGQGVRWAVAPHETWRISPSLSIASDIELARSIAANVRGMQLDAAAHEKEHGIEVQLPIIAKLAPHAKVTGVCMGAATWEELELAAEDLSQLLKQMPAPPLLMISSDMNHFANDQETRRRDALALEKLRVNDARGLLETCQQERISMCGQIPAALVLLTLQRLGVTPRFQDVGYATSSDVTQDKTRVVGYAGALWV